MANLRSEGWVRENQTLNGDCEREGGGGRRGRKKKQKESQKDRITEKLLVLCLLFSLLLKT